MTPIILLDALEVFIKDTLKDLTLPVRPDGIDEEGAERIPQVHKMRLPDRDSDTKLVPYILLQFLTGTDKQTPGQERECQCKIRIVAATYSEDEGIGAYDVLNVLTRIRTALLSSGIVGEQFLLKMDDDNQLEYIVYTENTAPYYIGEMITTWELPAIERIVNYGC